MKSLAAVLSVAALASVAMPALAAKPLQVHLNAQNKSGEAGTATLLQSGDNVIVIVRERNETDAAQPAHIHKGTCEKLDPKPMYPLTTLVNGYSETKIPNVKLADFTSGKFAINVHKSTKDIPTYVSCGNVVATDDAMMMKKP